MNALLLGLGDSGWEDPASESVLRHQEYARRAGGRIDLIIDSPRAGIFRHGELTVYLTGASRAQYFLAARRMALQAAHEHRPDLIGTQDPFGTALAGWMLRSGLKRPLLIQNHSSFMFNRYWLAERPVFFQALHTLARIVLPQADGWRVVNSAEKRIYMDRLRLPADRIRVLPVPCDLQPFLAADLAARAVYVRQRLSIPAGAPLLLWAGRPVRVKRLPILLDAFARLRDEFHDAHLILAGDKNLAQEDLDRAMRTAGVAQNSIWVGAITRLELAELFAAADVFLLSSAYEGFGRVLVEAGAAGLPAVSTATAGAAEIIRNGETGFLVPIDDPAAMAAQTAVLLGDVDLRKRMSSAAQTHVLARFNPEQAYEGVIAQWRDLAAEGLHR